MGKFKASTFTRTRIQIKISHGRFRNVDEKSMLDHPGAVKSPMVGVIYMSIMIGFVSNAMMDYAEALKLGTTSVEEFDHVLILGWSSSTLPLVEELCTAAASEKGGVIVILAETVKAEIEQAIDVHLRRKMVPGFRR